MFSMVILTKALLFDNQTYELNVFLFNKKKKYLKECENFEGKIQITQSEEYLN